MCSRLFTISKTSQWTISFLAFTYVSPSVHVTLNIVNIIWGCCFVFLSKNLVPMYDTDTRAKHKHFNNFRCQNDSESTHDNAFRRESMLQESKTSTQSFHEITFLHILVKHVHNSQMIGFQQNTPARVGLQVRNDTMTDHIHMLHDLRQTQPVSGVVRIGSIHEVCALFHCCLAYFSHLLSGLFQPFVVWPISAICCLAYFSQLLSGLFQPFVVWPISASY